MRTYFILMDTKGSAVRSVVYIKTGYIISGFGFWASVFYHRFIAARLRQACDEHRFFSLIYAEVFLQEALQVCSTFNF